MSSSQTNDKVTVSATSLEDVVAALNSVATALAANGPTGNGGGGGGGGTPLPTTPPTATQARVILDYLALNQLLARRGFAGRVVSAARDGQDIRLRGVPTTIDGRQVRVTKATVTPAVGPSQTAVVQPPKYDNAPDPEHVVTVDQIDVSQPIVRIELLDDRGVPVALGPRLAPVPDPEDCGDPIR